MRKKSIVLFTLLGAGLGVAGAALYYVNRKKKQEKALKEFLDANLDDYEEDEDSNYIPLEPSVRVDIEVQQVEESQNEEKECQCEKCECEKVEEMVVEQLCLDGVTICREETIQLEENTNEEKVVETQVPGQLTFEDVDFSKKQEERACLEQVIVDLEETFHSMTTEMPVENVVEETIVNENVECSIVEESVINNVSDSFENTKEDLEEIVDNIVEVVVDKVEIETTEEPTSNEVVEPLTNKEESLEVTLQKNLDIELQREIEEKRKELISQKDLISKKRLALNALYAENEINLKQFKERKEILGKEEADINYQLSLLK